MSDLPPGWEWTTIGEVGEVMLGRQRSPKWHFGPHMRPYLRVANVFEDRIDISDVKEMDFPPTHYERYKLEPGDILLNEGQSPEWVGRPAMYRGELPGACFTNSLIRFRPLPGVDGRYAFYLFLHHLHSRRFMREAQITTNIAHLSANRFKSVEFPLPPLREQERIVAAIGEHLPRLDAAGVAVRSAQRRIGVLSLALLARSQSEGEELALDDLLVDIEAGKSFKTSGRRATPDEWGVIKVSAMTWGNFDEAENKAVPLGRPVDRRHEILPGDLLLSRANTSEYVGATVLVGDCRRRLLLSDKSMRLLTREGVDRRWLRFALGSPQLRSQMSVLATGTSDSMRNISQAKVRRLRIRVPEADRQKALADDIEEALRAIGRLEADVQAIRKRAMRLRQSILTSAISGQLVAQDPADEPASVLLERLRVGPANSVSTRRTREASGW